MEKMIDDVKTVSLTNELIKSIDDGRFSLCM